MRSAHASARAGLLLLRAVGFLTVVLAADRLAVAAPTTQTSATTQSAAVAEPTFTLHLKDQTPEQALHAFSDATHVPFAEPAMGFWARGQAQEPAPAPARTINLDVKNETFWSALSDLQDATDLGFVTDANGEHITPTHERGEWGWTGRPEAECGPLLLSVRGVDRQTTLPLADPSQAYDQISVTTHVQIRPESGWMLPGDSIEITSMRTDGGAELLSRPAKTDVGTQPGRADFSVSAYAPAVSKTGSNAGAKIQWVTLIGKAHCVGSPSLETINIDNAESATIDRSITDLKIHLSTRRTARGVEVRLTTALPEGSDFHSTFVYRARLTRLIVNRMRMYDANGIELISAPFFEQPAVRRPTWRQPAPGRASKPTSRPSSNRTSGHTADQAEQARREAWKRAQDRSGDEVSANFLFTPADGPTPYNIVWKVPTANDDADFPIEIDQIPVP